jgi:UPF0755 protein
MDIKPVRHSVQPPAPQPLPQRPVGPVQQPPLPPIADAPVSLSPLPIGDANSKAKKVSKRKKWLIGIASIVALAILAASAVWVWYQVQLSPVNAENTSKIVIEVAPAAAPSDMAALLEDKGVIRNKTAFSWYARLNGVQNQLQAGSYRLSPSESSPEIIKHLVKGSVDTFGITFYPGATLTDNVSKADNRIDVTSVLLRAGYSQDEITAGLNKTYDHPLFQNKPASANLEGYIFGETYQFNSGASVEDILNRTFDEFYEYIIQHNLVAAYKQRGLDLYQGITLASIIQRESGGNDKPQIAQVFYTRLAMNMQLGSDVTYQYIADKEGGTRDPNYDSPYNTRRYVGLPPGPIAVPGLAALRAVAMPADGDYVYFLSGDDDVTYFARTLDEHETNILNHCKVKCQII